MEEIKLYDLIKEIIDQHRFIHGVISNKKNKSVIDYKKVEIKPFIKKEQLLFHFTFVYDQKVLHENLTPSETVEKIYILLRDYFKHGNIFTEQNDYQILISKKGKINIKKSKPSKKVESNQEHNRKKQYIIQEDEPCDFLEYLGVMNKEGKIHKKKRDKFKQINKYLEFVEGSLKYLDREKTLNIIDFGCGKAYLTFALYYYLVKMKDYNVKIIGLDLKEDVIAYCNQVSKDLGYEGLKFLVGDIAKYDEVDSVDMVMTLHACDIATDAALSKAIQWGAKVILSVPCCQHELFNQIANKDMKPMLKHGLIKERLSALVTDAARANLLETQGYEVTVIEFISMDHTPKNLMIKGVFTGKEKKEALEEYKAFKSLFSINPYLENELKL